MFGILNTLISLVYPVFASTIAVINSIDEPNLPPHINALQRWSIYWVILGGVTTIESVLPFITYLPGYSLLKVVFHIWLIIPMVVESDDRKASGAPWLFFQYVKPYFESNKEAIKKFVSNPFDLKTVLKLSSLAMRENNDTDTTTATTTGYGYASMLDGSIYMVKNIFTREVVTEEAPDNNTEEFDIVDKPEATEAYQKKGYFW
ncbi:unnamed protein product [Candida parapsilosis]|uniref:Protein YOP1 n=1 Tax=Candida parapsilosis (strain CDC 317 / ATCC MYA-4646) TaxID=578454 RepID=G8B5X1_CANPC|nr:uncharacterized protein CPAR2_109380 [Candida parapsilosis]CCE40900.1 hypothetical protein CPAR2_109380 [Candida parapsilosis]